MVDEIVFDYGFPLLGVRGGVTRLCPDEIHYAIRQGVGVLGGQDKNKVNMILFA